MVQVTSLAVCQACLDGTPVGVVPFGALRGRPACDACLAAIRDCGPGVDVAAIECPLPIRVQTSARPTEQP